MATDHDLKFARKPLATVARATLDAVYAATVRFDEERGIAAGDSLTIVDAESGQAVGTAVVDYTLTVPLRDALDVIARHGAYYGHETTDELCTALNRYYEECITVDSSVTVIVLKPQMSDLGRFLNTVGGNNAGD